MKNNNVTRTLLRGRSQIAITAFSPETVEQEVNRLYNVAAITGYPGERIEGERVGNLEITPLGDGRYTVTCATYKKRFVRGLLTLAEREMQLEGLNKTMRAKHGRNFGNVWKTRATIRAAHIYRDEFTVERKERE